MASVITQMFCTVVVFSINEASQYTNSPKGQTTVSVSENYDLILSCESHKGIYTIDAFYGFSSPICETLDTATGEHTEEGQTCSAENSRQIVSSACNNQRHCTVRASDEVFGNVCEGMQKYLQVKYICRDSPSWGKTVRLSEEYAGRGRVEVFLNGEWGTVCDDIWDMPAAEVVCRQLGFNESFRVLPAGTFQVGSGPIHLSRVECYGNETDLLACRHQTENICTHSNDAGVQRLNLENSWEGNPALSPWIVVITLVILLLVVTVFIMIWKRQNERAKQHSEPRPTMNNYTQNEMARNVDPMLKSKEIAPCYIFLHTELGRGTFGIVYKATVNITGETSKVTEAAVKTVKENADVEERLALVEEMKVMVQLGDHPNILPLLACCSVREPYYLVTVYMKYGDLRHFLRQCRGAENTENDSIFRVGEREKLMVALQIANGMAYVQEQRFFHGDLAARNILVGEGLDIKISDFGLSEDLYTKGYQRRDSEKRIPIKWCSLETILHGICSSNADVWSFGVVLYEIYTLGGTPYPGIESRLLVSQLKRGYRMESPSHCPDYIYDIMQRCWLEAPTERITFQEIVEKIDTALVQMTDYVQFFSEAELMVTTPKVDCHAASIDHDVIELGNSLEDDFAPILEEDNELNIDDLQAIIGLDVSSKINDIVIHTSVEQNDYI